jgi:hypothetical protein
MVLASAVILRFESRGTHDHILVSQIRDSPNMEGQVHLFISPRNRVAQLYPHALGSLFVTSYDSQGYGGGILPRSSSTSGLNLYVVEISKGNLSHRLFAITAEAFVARQCCNLHKPLPWKYLCIISLNRALFVVMFVGLSFSRK